MFSSEPLTILRVHTKGRVARSDAAEFRNSSQGTSYRYWSPTWGDMPYPIDPAKIAEHLGVKVYKADLSQTVSGMLIKQPARDPEIFLNGSDSQNRQRFSCAHELGHYVKRTTQPDGSAEEMEYVDFRNPLSAQGLNPDEVLGESIRRRPSDAARAGEACSQGISESSSSSR